ncbi:acyl-CoA thioesterase [Clostridium paraputrificum]|uniref:acyl-CoA thioesterase n=1 Tax=Clostridium TaxID=1485 RepID=UPI003D338920
MEWLKYRYKVSVRFRDTDAYGIVHHSNFFCYFEEARYDFSKYVLKFQEDMIDGKRIKFPVLEAYCNYRHAVKYMGEELYVDVSFRTVNDSKIEFKYTLISEDNKKVYATGRTVHAFVDENDKLCLTIPTWFRDKL